MKMSRVSLLLSAVVFVSPLMVNANTTTDDLKTEVQQVVANVGEAVKNTVEDVKEKAAEVKTQVEEKAAEVKAQVQALVTQTSSTTDTTSTTGTTTEQKAGVIAAISAALVAGRNTVFSGLDTIAKYTLVNTALTKLATFETFKGGRFEKNIPAIQEAIVAAALVGLGYMAYQAYVNQNTEDFDADFDADNN